MDEYEYPAKFFAALGSEELWKPLISEIRNARARAEDGGWLDGKPFDEADYKSRVEHDLFRTFAYGGLADDFEERLLKDFAFPPITAFELSEIATQQLSGALTDHDFATAIERFIAHVAKATYFSCDDIRISDDIRLGGVGFSLAFGNNSRAEQCSTLWESPYGFYLAFSGRVDAFTGVSACLWGKMTEPAMKAAYDVVQRVVMSAMKTLNLLNADRQQQNRFGLVPFEVNREAVAQDLTKTGGGLLSQMMSSYFLPPAKKTSSFEQRLRNAVHLLVEADAQSHKAIALSLCFSAIEAMVCEKTDGIVDELSRHVSVLLQPTAMERPKAI